MKKWIYRILLIICLGIFLFSAFQLWTIYSIQNQVKEETESLQKAVTKDENLGFIPDWEALQNENSDVVAWLYIPECDISYPVVQGNDNQYYLDHTVKKEENRFGAIFLSAEASPDFSQDNSLIYGHSVDIGGMFTNLSYFEDQNFFDQHPYFYVLTPTQNYRCTISWFAKTADGSIYYTSSFGGQRNSLLSQMKENAYFTRDVDISDGSFVTLSTCDLDYGFDSAQRLILTGKLEPYNDPISFQN